MSDDPNHFRNAEQALKAADDALSSETEMYRLRRAQVHATLAQSETGNEALGLAWRVHDAAAGSIGKADAKAGFFVTLDTAILAAVLTVGDLDRLGSVARVLLATGVLFLAVAILAAVGVVLPILRARHATERAAGDFLYFGAVRTHTPGELADRLIAEDTVQGVCAQSITLARLAWLKHRLLQVSMLATIAGSNLVGWTLLLAGGR